MIAPRPDFATGHQSGLWSASPEQWRLVVRDLVSMHVDLTPVSLWAFTETTQLTPWKPGDWNAFHDGPAGDTGRDECAIIWDTAVWEAVGPGWAEPLTDHTFRLDDGRVRPRVHAICQPLRHIATGVIIVRVVLHSPSGVDAGHGLRVNVRASVARGIIKGRRRLKKKIRKRFPGCLIVESADENVDLRRRWARRVTKAAGGVAVWIKKRLPGRGTHGHRLIDSFRISRGLAVTKARVLDRIRPFDHNPIVVALRVRRSNRRKKNPG